MTEFQKYMHLERYGNDEVQGIEFGTCYIFPKLDGTNGSVWMSPEGIRTGSRNRELSLDNDNAGFCKAVCDDKRIIMFLYDNPNLRLFGEWLVPHSLKTYQENAWRKFYIFDVMDTETGDYLRYDQYQPMLEKFDIDYIPAMSVIDNATYESLLKEIDKNQFLIKDGEGSGEGITIKNYDYRNKYGRPCFAKIVTNAFKEKHAKEMGPHVLNATKMVEQEIVDKYIDKPLVEKSYSKIVNEREGWNSRYIPQLFGLVWHDLITEEIWDIIKKMKNPVINFKTLNTLAIMRIKNLMPELF